MLGDPPLPTDMQALRPRLVAEVIGDQGDGDNLSERLCALVLAEDNRARLLLQARSQRRLLQDYLAEALGDEQHVDLVDLGGQCSTGAVLHREPELSGGRKFHNYLFYGVANLAEKLMQGMSIDVFTPMDRSGLQRTAVIQRSPQVLELLLNGNEPTTLAYERSSSGQAVPVTVVPIEAADQRKRLAAVYDGIRAFGDMAATLDLVAPMAPPDAETRRYVLDMVYRLIHVPTVEEAQELGSLLYDYTGEASARPVVGNDDVQLSKSLLPVGQPHLLKLAMLTQRAILQWPQGAITQAEPDLIIGLHEAMRLDSGHGVAGRLLLARVLAARAG